MTTQAPVISLPETTEQFLAHLSTVLPFPLALLLSEYVREADPFVKLHRLTDTAELLTRFAATVVLSDVLRQQGEFPDSVRQAVLPRQYFAIAKGQPSA